MKFWLLIFLFTTDGEFIAKREFQYASKRDCIIAAGSAAQTMINKPVAITQFCVSDNHHKGISQDAGVPLDF